MVGEYLMLFFGKSDVGKTRSTNEDNYITLELAKNLILCVICDGIGGYQGGNIASELAIITFTEYLKTHLLPFVNPDNSIFNHTAALSAGIKFEDILSKAVYASNTTIRQRGSHDQKLKDMGTTLIAALIIDNILYVANVGDSRLYIVDNDETIQVTHDHSYVQLLIDAGKITAEEAAKSPYRNVIIRSVGTESFADTDTDIYELEFNSGFILMCSDGLYNYFKPHQYNEFLKDVNDINTLTNAVDKLVETANAHGGKDNITVILIKAGDNGDNIFNNNIDVDIKINTNNTDLAENS